MSVSFACIRLRIVRRTSRNLPALDLPANVREAEEVERSRPVPVDLAFPLGRSAKADQPSLVRVQFQGEQTHSLAEVLQELLGLPLVFEIPPARHRHNARRRRRRALCVCATVQPTGRGRNAGTRSRAAAKPSLLAAYPVRTPSTSRLQARPPRPATSGTAAGPSCPLSDARETSPAIRGRWCRRTRGCRHRAPSSPSCVRSRPPAHPALGAGCSSGPESVRKAEKVLLVDGVEHLDDGPLDNLVLQRGNSERPLPPVRLRDVHSPRGPRPVRSSAQSVVQVPKILFGIDAVLLPCHPIDSSRCVLLQLPECGAQ